MQSRFMRNIAISLLSLTCVGVTQSSQQTRTLVINGHAGDAVVYQIDGRSCIDLETLARISNGSVRLSGNQIILTIPLAGGVAGAEPGNAGPRMSTNFMNASLQSLATMREWTNTLAYAAQHGVPGDGSRLVILHDRAAEHLRLAQVAATSDADQNAFQLLTTLFHNVANWNDKLISEHRSMDTAKYSLTPDSVINDPSYQKIAACTRFLSSMLPGGEFANDNSCR